MFVRGPGQFGESRAVDDDGFAERDDDEAGAALGHVAALDRPGLDRREPEPRHPEAHRRRDIFDRERDDPQPRAASRPRQVRPRSRTRAETAEPDQDADRVVRAQRCARRGVANSKNSVRPTCMAA